MEAELETASNSSQNAGENKENRNQRIFKPRDHAYHFDPAAYLRTFYSDVKNMVDGEMTILSLMPNCVLRVPPGGRLLDIGTGPTVYIPLCFRNHMKEIFLSDYCEANRQALNRWLAGRPTFDWTKIEKMIAEKEGCPANANNMSIEARAKVKGILACDVHDPGVTEAPELGPFDVVTTVFCVEFACMNSDEYHNAAHNVFRLVKPGGYIIMGGLLEEPYYCFESSKFTAHNLTEQELMQNLEEGGFDMDRLVYFKHEAGVFLIVGQKKQ